VKLENEIKSVHSGINGSKKAHMSKLQTKKILITFFHIKDIVYFEFIPQGQTVNQAHYKEISKRLREVVCRKRPELWLSDWIPHFDSTPSR
jgi:hypothetical protein